MAEAPIPHLKSFPRLMMESPCPFSCKSASALEIYKRFFNHGSGKIRQHLINCSLRRWGPFGGIIFSFLALCVDDKCDKYISPVTATVCSYDLNRLTVFTRTISWGGGRSAVIEDIHLEEVVQFWPSSQETLGRWQNKSWIDKKT